MKKQLEIDYAFGYVYDKSKLIVMYPVGTNTIDLEEYEKEVEVAFLEDGIEVAFEEEDIKVAHDTIKPLDTFLMKPSKVIPFVVSIKDAQTKEELPKLLKEFDDEYEIKENYIKKGYEIRDVYHVFENVVNYIPKENLETLNILKIEKDKFDMESFIKLTKENLKEVIDEKLIPTSMKKSELTPRIYVKSEGESKYIPFAIYENVGEGRLVCANDELIEDLSVDMGDLEISNTKDVGYIVDEVEGNLTFKIVNYNSQTSNNNQIAQVVDYSGILKMMMISFVNKFIK